MMAEFILMVAIGNESGNNSCCLRTLRWYI